MMPEEIREKLFWIRVKSKTGEKLEGWEFDFCGECHKKYPEDYRIMEKEVFDETSRRVNPLYKL